MKNKSALQSLLIGMFVVLLLAASSSSAAPKRAETQPSLQIEFAASRAQVCGREVAGFIARQPDSNRSIRVGSPPVTSQQHAAITPRPFFHQAKCSSRGDSMKVVVRIV